MPRRPRPSALAALLALALVAGSSACGDDGDAAAPDPKVEAYCSDAVQFGNALRNRGQAGVRERDEAANNAEITQRMQENVPPELADDQAKVTAFWSRLSEVLATAPPGASARASTRKLEEEPVYKDAVTAVAEWANERCADS